MKVINAVFLNSDNTAGLPLIQPKVRRLLHTASKTELVKTKNRIHGK